MITDSLRSQDVQNSTLVKESFKLWVTYLFILVILICLAEKGDHTDFGTGQSSYQVTAGKATELYVRQNALKVHGRSRDAGWLSQVSHYNNRIVLQSYTWYGHQVHAAALTL